MTIQEIIEMWNGCCSDGGSGGGGGDVLFITATEGETGIILDKTFGEIFSALDSGIMPVMKLAIDSVETEWYTIGGLSRKNPGTECSISFGSGNYTFIGVELSDYGVCYY